jgi:protein-S-isoprenylcysteine O-methyltransferase Ste14
MTVNPAMSTLWIIRLTFVGMFFLFVIICGIFLKDREKHEKYLENRVLNLIVVIVYSIFAYVPVLLPSDPNVIPNTIFTEHQFIISWYIVLGSVLFVIGVTLYIISLRIRKTVGAEDTDGKLITSGSYGFCRHPLYLGCSLICLGFALLFHNLDGLLVVPLIVLINLLMGKIEEKYDMGIRFKEEYPKYKMQTRAFGPIWFWIVLIITIILPAIIGLVVTSPP